MAGQSWIAREDVDTIRCRANDTPWGNNPWLVIRVAREDHGGGGGGGG